MIKQGTLLIAPPSVQHNLWGSSTILITDIEGDNAIGLITNKISRMSLSEFGDRLGYDLDHVSGMLHIGGPERQTSFTILHSPEWKCKNTYRISKHFSITSNDDVLKRFQEGDEPNQWRMFLGMCVWPVEKLTKQITGDITGNSYINWCTSTCDPELIFDADLDDTWDIALERCSLEFAQNFML
jgi:putative AlgH/UPF0301 family transcriptional regulator